MTADEYQKQALTTAIPHADPQMDKSIRVMGIAGEAGEVVEKWKKIVAYKDGIITAEDTKELVKEMGDVIWYVAVLANSLGVSLEDVLQMNLNKLADRKSRGVTKGAGDNR